MQYAEFPPFPSLAATIECLWTLSGSAATLGPATQPVLPDGRPELILHFGDVFERVHADGRVERQPALIFAGQLRSQLLLKPTGVIRVLGVRFHPFGAAAVIRTPLNELAGMTIGVDSLAPPLSRALAEVRTSGIDLNEAVTCVQRVLTRWIDPDHIDERVRAAVQIIGRSRGRVGIDNLAVRASMTRRHLERRFLATVGVTPKRLARIARFQHALRILENPDEARGAKTALTCGYADQAHFIRDFRELAGCPPGEHMIRQGELTGVFSGHQ